MHVLHAERMQDKRDHIFAISLCLNLCKELQKHKLCLHMNELKIQTVQIYLDGQIHQAGNRCGVRGQALTGILMK